MMVTGRWLCLQGARGPVAIAQEKTDRLMEETQGQKDTESGNVIEVY